MQDPGPTRSASLPLALVVLSALFVLVQIRAQPPRPLPLDAPGDRFSAARAGRILNTLVGDGQPHPVGTSANARVRELIVAQLSSLGYRPDVQAAFTCGTNGVCATVHNVLARLPGRERRPAVLLATHYDSVAAGPGAADAGASVAGILEIARILESDSPHPSPIILLIDDGEEAGLLGAQAFAEAHPWAAEVGVVVNLEARGTSGASLMFEVSGESAWLVRRLATSLSRPAASSLFYPVYERLPNDTDLTVFKRFGKPGVNFAFIGDVVKYHTPLDNVQNVSPASLQHQGDNALAVTRALAATDLAQPLPKGNVVFFDVLGLGIARWPVPMTLPLAIAALAFVLTGGYLMVRRGIPVWRSVLGFIGWVLAIGAAGLVAWGLARLQVPVFRGDATTQPVLAIGASWLLGLAVSTFVAALLGRWTLGGGAWTGCWVGWSLAAIIAARVAPETAYMLVVPAAVAGLSGTFVGLVRPAHSGWIAGILPLVAAGVLWMPPAWFLFDALGVQSLPVTGGAIAMLGTGLAPFVAEAGSRWRWALPAVSLAVALVIGSIAMKAPSFSAGRPERMNIAFFQEATAGEARWIVQLQSRRLPAAMREAAPFLPEPSLAFPWATTETAFAAPAASIEIPGPQLDILSRGRSEGHRTVMGRLLSPRGAKVAMVLLPADRTIAVSIGGRRVPRRVAPGDPGAHERGSSRFRSYASYSLPADGVDIEIVIAGEEPLDVFVLDQTSGLPPGGDVLVRARPREATRSGFGDATMIARRVTL